MAVERDNETEQPKETPAQKHDRLRREAHAVVDEQIRNATAKRKHGRMGIEMTVEHGLLEQVRELGNFVHK